MRYLKKRSFLCPFCSMDHDASTEFCPRTEKRLGAIHKMGGSVLDGKYRVESVIGTGGMGVVYEGLNKVIDRKIAIKFLSPDSSGNEEARSRFINEAKIAAALGHKNIIGVLDLGETSDGIPYIVMEYLEGENLGDHLDKQGRLKVPRAVEITVQILDGLHAVHSEGVIHRDLKPENVFLAKQSGGQEIVKLLDFGISRLDRGPGDPSRLTEAGRVYGTPYYVSPEQAEGKLDVDHRADIYSVGVLLYEMTTGQLPFKSASYATLMVDIITRPAPDPRDHLPWMPVDVVAVISKALAKNPASRYGSAREMARALDLLNPGAQAQGHIPSDPPRMARPSPVPQSPRDSFTGYRIVAHEKNAYSENGPLARARKRRSSKPPELTGHVDIPSPPHPIPVHAMAKPARSNLTTPIPTMSKDAAAAFAASASTEERVSERPSDPLRQTPRVVPENGAAMRPPTRTGAGADEAPSEPREQASSYENKDDIDRGWDF